MKPKHYFILSISGIFAIILLAQNETEFQSEGKIESMTYNDGSIEITLENQSENFILFGKNFIDIKIQEEVKILGRKSEEQIIIDKIIKCY